MTNSNDSVNESFRRRRRNLYFSLGLGALVLFGITRYLADALEQQLTAPRALTFRVSRGLPAGLTIKPTPTDTFLLHIDGAERFHEGYNSKKWTIQRVQFRPNSRTKWRTLNKTTSPATLNSFDGTPFLRAEYAVPKRQLLYELSGYVVKPPGEYQMRARLAIELNDNRSGAIYIGAQTFDFDFHIDKMRKAHLDLIK